MNLPEVQLEGEGLDATVVVVSLGLMMMGAIYLVHTFGKILCCC